MDAVVIFVVVAGSGRIAGGFIGLFHLSRFRWELPGVNPRPSLRGTIPGQPADQSVQRAGQSAKEAGAQAGDVRRRFCDLPANFTGCFGSGTLRLSGFILVVSVFVWHW
jgi:hypothetical protein